MTLAGMVSSATLARGFAGYFQVLVDLPDALLIVCLLAALGFTAAWGIKSSVRIAATLTIIEAGGLVMIVVVAGGNLDTVPESLPYQHVTGGSPVVISSIGLVAVINGALVQIIMAARIFYGMSVNGWLPRVLGTVNPRTRTPVTATVVVVVIVAVLALWFPLVSLASATSFLVLTVFGLVNLTLVVLKRRQPRAAGVVPCPMWIPMAGATASFGLLAAQGLR